MPRRRTATTQSRTLSGITGIAVAGFKSLARKQGIEIRPLTVLAGANSSGKSSAIQPLLMLKQTLEASYDPGPLLLNGPNVRFTSADQFLSRLDDGVPAKEFYLAIDAEPTHRVVLEFSRGPEQPIKLQRMQVREGSRMVTLREGMTGMEIAKAAPPATRLLASGRFRFPVGPNAVEPRSLTFSIERERCFLVLSAYSADREYEVRPGLSATYISELIQSIVHIPALRGNPERAYPTTAVGAQFPGTFEKYVASVINGWWVNKDERLEKLGAALRELGLSSVVEPKTIDETQVELRVGRRIRRKQGPRPDTVNIADVGYGVSQVLPVLVALLVARPGQLCYVEQPEIHLHPKAQTALAGIIADAAKRGVRVVVETHSNLLLLGLQTLVAEGKLPPEVVKLHWFSRSLDGSTTIRSADIDKTGAFDDWPIDFWEVEQKAESRYLDAAETRLAVGQG